MLLHTMRGGAAVLVGARGWLHPHLDPNTARDTQISLRCIHPAWAPCIPCGPCCDCSAIGERDQHSPCLCTAGAACAPQLPEHSSVPTGIAEVLQLFYCLHMHHCNFFCKDTRSLILFSPKAVGTFGGGRGCVFFCTPLISHW